MASGNSFGNTESDPNQQAGEKWIKDSGNADKKQTCHDVEKSKEKAVNTGKDLPYADDNPDSAGISASNTVSDTGSFPKAWDSYDVRFILQKGKTVLKTLDASETLKPTIMQFLYSCHKQEAEDKLKTSFSAELCEKKLNVYVEGDPFQSEDYKNDDNIILFEIFDHLDIEENLTSLEPSVPKSAVKRVYAELLKHPPEKEFPGKVTLYQGEDMYKLHVVGKKEIVEKTLRKISEIRKQGQLDHTRKQEEKKEEVLAEFQFRCNVEQFLCLGIEKLLTDLSLKYQRNDGEIVVTGCADAVKKAEKLLQDFSKSICKRQLVLSSTLIKLFQSKPTAEFIEKKATEQNLKCYFQLIDNRCIEVSALSDEMLGHAVSVIQREMVEYQVFRKDLIQWEFYHSPAFDTLEKENVGKIYSLPISREEVAILVVCTTDVYEKINSSFETFTGQKQSQQKNTSHLSQSRGSGSTSGNMDKEMSNQQARKRTENIETKVVTMDIPFDEFSLDLFKVFAKEIKDHLCKIDKNINFTTSRKEKCILFQGKEAVLKEINSIVNKYIRNNFKLADTPEMSEHKIRYYCKSEVREFVNSRLSQETLQCAWTLLQKSVRVYGLDDKVVVKAAHLIKMCVQEHMLMHDGETADIVEQLIASGQMKDLISKLYINSNEQKDLIIVTTDDFMPIVLEMVSNEKDKAAQKTEAIEIDVPVPFSKFRYIVEKHSAVLKDINKNGEILTSDKSCFVLKGAIQDVKKAQERLLSLINTIHTHDVVKSEESYRKLIHPAGGSKQWEKLEELHDCRVGILDGFLVDKQPKYVDLNCRITDCFCFHEVQGHITDVEADLILCPVNSMLNPVGPGSTIVQRGGGELAQVLKTKQKTEGFMHLNEGAHFSSSNTGSLHCSRIFYYILPDKIDGRSKFSKKEAEGMFSEIFRWAAEVGYKTVAVPFEIEDEKIRNTCLKALVKSRVKLEENILSTALKYGTSNEKISKTHIYLFTESDSTRESIHQKLLKELKGCSLYGKIDFSILLEDSETDDNSPINKKVSYGSLTDHGIASNVDMLVNSADPKLKFEGGIIAQSILKHGGYAIKEECSKRCKHGLSYGEVLVTGSGHLSCKNICHCVLYPHWDQNGNISLKVLECVMLRCMIEAEHHKCKKIAFPALGTGTLGYPYHKVAEVMLNSVDKYGKHNPDTCITDVNFVIWKDDGFTAEAFQQMIIRQKEFQICPMFVEIRPEMNTEMDWLETILNDSFHTKIQLLPRMDQQYEKTKVIVQVQLSSPTSQGSTSTDEEVPNHHYKIKEDVYEIPVQYTNDRDFQAQIEKCLNFANKRKLLSVAFDFVAFDGVAETKMYELIQLTKGTALNHKVDYVNVVKIYFGSDDQFGKLLDLCERNEQDQKDTWMTTILNYFNFKDMKMVKWSRKNCDMRSYLTRAVQISVASSKLDKAKLALSEIIDDVEMEKQMKGKSMTRKQREETTTLEETSSIDNKENKPHLKSNNGGKFSKDVTGDVETAVGSHAKTMQLSREKREKESNKPNILSKVCAYVNAGILKLSHKELEYIKEHLETKCKVKVNWNIQAGTMKLEGSLVHIKNAKKYLQDMSEGKAIKTNDDDDDDSLPKEYNNVIVEPMSKSEFDKLMRVWGNEYKENHGVQIDFDNGALLLSNSGQGDGNDIEKEIQTQMKRIEEMTVAEIPFKREELVKIKSISASLESEFKEVYFSVDREKLILYAIGNYSYEQRQTITHRVNLLLGHIQETKTRRGRRFGAGDDIEVGQKDKHHEESFSSLPGNSSNFSDSRSSSYRRSNSQGSSTEKKRFVTTEGIDVFVYNESILQLNVDCIVNAANENLAHGAGVAAVIARGAGYRLDQECKDYIRHNGQINIGDCCHTTAGDLPYKYVIHTVGPRWSNSMDSFKKRQCLDDLQSAIESCFNKADELGMESIGVPSVSAGLFGMPQHLCAQQYCEAIKHYSEQRFWKSKPTSLKEIHFIDRDVSMCSQIESVFSSSLKDNQDGSPQTGQSGSRSFHRSFSSSSHSGSFDNSSYDSSKRESKGKSSFSNTTEECTYKPCSWLTVHLLESNIRDVDYVEAVVSPENLGFKNQGGISKSILEKAGERYKRNYQKFQSYHTNMKDVFPMEKGTGLSWKYLFFAIAPRWSDFYIKHNQQFEKDLKETVEKVLKEASNKGVKSVAIPLLGAAIHGLDTPLTTCCRAMLDGIESFSNVSRTKNWTLDIWIVTTDSAAVVTLKDMLKKRYGDKEDPSVNVPHKQIKHTDHGQKQEVNEDCCICLDKISDPKWLPCKHVFCTDCIDQQFKFKPACPQCGSVHGKLTGDQPPGTMTTVNQYYSLPGYENCRTIAVTYTFPSGRQSKDHPNPGKHYSGIERTGYLPDNEKGRLVVKLLRIAFDRKLMFTIGRSVTTGNDGVITWNDIHHKTRTHGGPQSFGYPDPTYLDRVLDELAAKGVTKESLNDP